MLGISAKLLRIYIMSNHDIRGEIYRGWLIVPIPVGDRYLCELHSPEGYRNINPIPFSLPEDAVTCGRKEIDEIIKLFEGIVDTENNLESLL